MTPTELDRIIAACPFAHTREMLTRPTPLARGSTGPHIRLMQELICFTGDPIARDGVFGPLTAAAVERLQARQGLTVTGVIDAATHACLVAPIARANRMPLGPLALQDAIVRCARQHLAERPCEIGGDDRGPWVRMYLRGLEDKWCAGFVSHIMQQAAHASGVGLVLKRTGSCDLLVSRARTAGLFIPEAIVRERGPSVLTAGMLFVVRRTPSDWTHTGVVVALDDHSFTTIEGNASDDGDESHCEVCQNRRPYDRIDFIQVG